VNPTRSQNNTETTFRSVRAGRAAAPSAVPQEPQNRNPSGFSSPQFVQIATVKPYALATRSAGRHQATRPSPWLRSLDERLARGEIDLEEYQRLRDAPERRTAAAV
jgi:hypothetical protein